MIQGGGFNDRCSRRNRTPIKNEADNGLRNTAARSRWRAPQIKDSATSQVLINAVITLFDHGQRDFGYAVFASGKGMDAG